MLLKRFHELQEYLQTIDDAVIDIGASNVEDFVKLMKQYHGSHEDFDFFVVPTVPAKKQQRDTISTIDALAALGVPAKKIRMVFNMVDVEENPERIFDGLIEYQKAEKKFTLKTEALIHINDIYSKLKDSSTSIADILADQTDYKEKIKTAKDADEKLQFAQMVSVKRLAVGVTAELDAVFKALFK